MGRYVSTAIPKYFGVRRQYSPRYKLNAGLIADGPIYVVNSDTWIHTSHCAINIKNDHSPYYRV